MRALLSFVAMSFLVVCPFACAKGDSDENSTTSTPKEAGSPVELEGGTITGSDATADAGPDPRLADLHAATDYAFEVYFRTYWTGSTIRDDRTKSDSAGYWGIAQSYDVVLDAVERTGRYKGLIESMYNAKNVSSEGWIVGFFDDEVWMSLALMRAFDLTGEAKYLAKAEDLFNDIATNASDSTCCGTTPGGIWWDKKHTSKACASNMGAVVVATRLTQRTGKDHLPFANAIYDYWLANMTDPTTFHIYDHINNGDPAPNTEWTFTYNEGLAIAASLELYKMSKDQKYLQNAHKIAAYMVEKETADSSYGKVLTDGTDGDKIECNDGMMFKGIGFRYLAQLQAVSPKPEYQAVLDASAMGAWKTARTSDGFFSYDWAKAPTQSNPCMMAQNSGLMAMSLFASSLGPSPTKPDAAAWEAEDGVIHGIGIEASQVGFHGWGYVAGWNNDGQWVDFKVATNPGKYVLHFDFAAGAGDAKRLIYVNGKSVNDNFTFASTGAWSTYAVADVTVDLIAENTISVIYDGGKGSTNFLNLDRMTMTPAP